MRSYEEAKKKLSVRVEMREGRVNWLLPDALNSPQVEIPFEVSHAKRFARDLSPSSSLMEKQEDFFGLLAKDRHAARLELIGPIEEVLVALLHLLALPAVERLESADCDEPGSCRRSPPHMPTPSCDGFTTATRRKPTP